RAIHIKENGFAGVARRDVELLAVPTNSRTRQPPHRSADATGVERAFDRPVMRQIYRTPAAVIEVGPHVRDVAPWIFIGPRDSVRRVGGETIAGRSNPSFEHWIRRCGKF